MALAEAHDSSSYHRREWKSEYDVFLSFRGEDTRFGFTGHLYDAFTRQGIKAFIDHECLTRGVEISPDLVKSIEGSRASIIVFSENYASSSWCLDELVKILHCMQLRGQLVLPVFYKIDPSIVRKQTGTYEKAMAEYENQSIYTNHKVNQWRSALRQAANLSGWHVEESRYEFQYIQDIVENVSGRLNRQMLHVSAYPVGLESRKLQVISRLGLHEFKDDVRMVGINGMGGIGKSTIARAVYNSIAHQFDGASFLSEVRETSSQRRGLVALQEKLLGDILGGKNKVELGDIYKGISVIRERLCDKKILLIIDDVNKLEQLEALAGVPHWFGHGSRILITTRDKHLLTAHNVTNIYEVDLLNEVQAMELFSWHAFGKRQPDSNYQEISKRVAKYAERLPLALEIIGRAFAGRSLEECEDALDKYKSIPEGNIIDKLKISYDELDDFERKIFLDIACFFNGKDLKYIHSILEASDLNPTIGLKKLVERGLLTERYNVIRMHSLIHEMGREIVRRASPSDVGERSRLWHHEDVIQVLTENMGTKAVEGIMLDLPCVRGLDEEIEWDGEGFKEMKNLRILIMRNARFSTAPTYLPNSLRVLRWEKYPSSSFPPPSFHPKKLVKLEVPYSHLTLTEKPFKRLEALREMIFSFCYFITKVPDLSGVPNLQVLELEFCWSLVEVHDSVGSLGLLEKLSTRGCRELTTLPHALKLSKLKQLDLSYCPKLCRFPDIQEPMENLEYFGIDESGIEAFPNSIKYVNTLTSLRVWGCKRLKIIPHTVSQMQSLSRLSFLGCPLIGNALTSFDLNICSNISYLDLHECNILDEHLALIPKFFPFLRELSLRSNQFEAIPECFRALKHLEFLNLDDCEKLRQFPNILPDLPKMRRISAADCVALRPQCVDLILKAMVKSCWSSPHVNADISLSGRIVPEWFHQRSERTVISFYARGKCLPHFLVYISVVRVNKEMFTPYVNYGLCINGHAESSGFIVPSDAIGRRRVLHIVNPHVPGSGYVSPTITRNWVCGDWNSVEIHLRMRSTSVLVEQFGIHFDEEQISMEDISFSLPETGAIWRQTMAEQEAESNWVIRKVPVESTQQFKTLEEDHIEQMIEELLDYGSIELFPAMQPQAM